MVLQGDEGQRQARSTVEEEGQGHVETLDGAGGLGGLEVGHALVHVASFVQAEQTVVHAVPVGEVLVDGLATDLQVHLLQQGLGGVERAPGAGGLLQGDLAEDVGDQIAVAGDLGGHLVAVADGAVDGLLDGLDGEVGVAAVHHLEERDLGVTGQVHVLSAVRDELRSRDPEGFPTGWTVS